MSHSSTNHINSDLDVTVTAYDLFILGVTILSLLNFLIIIIPFLGATENAIAWDMDFVYSMIFLADFLHSFRVAQDRRGYFLKGGWLDLVGSIPFIAILRLFRLARALRIIRIARHIGWRALRHQYRQNVVESAFWTTALATILLLVITTMLIVPIESQSQNAQITSPADAMWWSVVTATTVGYGDMVPVTSYGRFLGMSLMTLGVTFVSILTSYFTSKIYLAREAEGDAIFEEMNASLENIDRRLQTIENALQKQENDR